MADCTDKVRCVVQGSATRLASRIARCVEERLVARAVKLASRESARNAKIALVTIEHIRRVLDRSLLEETVAQSGLVLHDETEENRARSIAG